ncbi:Virginiamycin B lyase [Enhygromyxa salina]|uniref:Virginiamycin B lyase n=1 Tax=Enhygromyxa salina TaxID=215803 RepID=A0A2S9YFE6_9BACT|nr:hypothetical protein [Enhygromyxa salina]PRQ03835.1 Virginiamycin B lyase [Enhygromyxa salina]
MFWPRLDLACLCLALPLAASCGGDGSGRSSTGVESGVSLSGVETGEGVGDGDGDSGDGDGDGDPGDGDGDPGDGDGDGVKFDVNSLPDGDGGNCGGEGMGGDSAFSYIWIANSTQGTVSKINTVDGVEEGRYWTTPNEGDGNPSRTSVNLLGDVAVSNRTPGSVTKVAALEERCVDANNNGMIDTSTGPDDIRAWGEDECVLWNLPIPSLDYNHGPRPTAWEGGKFEGGDDPCAFDDNPRLWVGYKNNVTEKGIFLRIDGATGQILDTVEGPTWVGISAMGPYGGAVNANGDFIVTGLNYGNAIRIDADTLEVTEIADVPQTKYGMGLDKHGNIWVGGYQGSVFHYDFGADSWTTFNDVGGGRVNGIMVDRDGYAWGAGSSPCRLVQIDTEAMQTVNGNIPLPGCGSPWGISIDRDGFVWVVDMSANVAFKVNPDTYQVELTVSGLINPYTYSDMTGAGLNLVVNPPG